MDTKENKVEIKEITDKEGNVSLEANGVDITPDELPQKLSYEDQIKHREELLSHYVKPHTKNSREVEEKDFSIILRDAPIMFSLCYAPIGLYGSAKAIAHSQINDEDPLRFFITNDGHIIVNPVIINHTKTTVDSKEACMTFPDKPMIIVQRYNKCVVSYYLFDGEKLIKQEENLSGEIAKVFQHEIQHMGLLGENNYIY